MFHYFSEKWGSAIYQKLLLCIEYVNEWAEFELLCDSDKTLCFLSP